MEEEIASNRRRSVLFVGLLVLAWFAIGAVGGLLYGWIDSTPSPDTYSYSYTSSSSPASGQYDWRLPISEGVLIGGLLALGSVIYSIHSGPQLVLRSSGATPADPIQYQQLHNIVDALSIGEGIPKPAVYVIDDPSPNAFATGFSPDKASITFTTGLLELMDRDELEGVASHELSHIKNQDIRLLLVVGTMIGLATFLAVNIWRIRARGKGALLIIVVGALFAVVGFLLGPLIRFALSRRRESLADACGVELTRNPAGLLSALRKLQASELPLRTMNHVTAPMCIDDPYEHRESWYRRLYATHPPIEERIAALERILSVQVL